MGAGPRGPTSRGRPFLASIFAGIIRAAKEEDQTQVLGRAAAGLQYLGQLALNGRSRLAWGITLQSPLPLLEQADSGLIQLPIHAGPAKKGCRAQAPLVEPETFATVLAMMKNTDELDTLLSKVEPQ